MLKYVLFFFLVQLIGINLHAQYRSSNMGRITVVSESQPFILSLNGVAYNDRPELQVTIDGLSDQLYAISALKRKRAEGNGAETDYCTQ